MQNIGVASVRHNKETNMKSCLQLVTREMQIRMTARGHCTPVRMTQADTPVRRTRVDTPVRRTAHADTPVRMTWADRPGRRTTQADRPVRRTTQADTPGAPACRQVENLIRCC